MSANGANMLAAALGYAGAGIRVHPLNGRTKAPLTSHGFHDASADREQIETWWARWPDAAIGSPEFDAVDVDLYKPEAAATWAQIKPLIPEGTPQTATGGGGLQFLFAPGTLKNGTIGPAIDSRYAGSNYVILPPSLHSSGRRYEWKVRLLGLKQLKPAPDFPHVSGSSSEFEYLREQMDAGEKIRYGRNKAAWWRAVAVLRSLTGTIDVGAVEQLVQAWVNANCAGDLSEVDVPKQVKGAVKFVADERAEQPPPIDESEVPPLVFDEENPIFARVDQPGNPPDAPANTHLWLLDAAELLAEPDPGPTPFLVDGLIVQRAIVAMVGRWKTTKSYGLLYLLICVAIGEPAWGLATPKDGVPVVYVCEESGRAALWRRLDALCRGYAVDPERLRERLYVAANARARLDDPGWQAELIAIGRELHPGAFAFDPMARMKAAARQENEQTDMAVVIEYLRQLRDETQAGVGFVHHTGHHGEHMRGSSDLESAWETRLMWKREGSSPEVTITSEHREAEAAPSLRYRIAWDHETRTMRFPVVEGDLKARVRAYLADHPDASGNTVIDALSTSRQQTFAAIREIREEGGSEAGNHPGTTPSGSDEGSGSAEGAYKAPGTTPVDPGTEVVPDDENRKDCKHLQQWLACDHTWRCTRCEQPESVHDVLDLQDGEPPPAVVARYEPGRSDHIGPPHQLDVFEVIAQVEREIDGGDR